MAVQCGWASIDERGRARGGVAGQSIKNGTGTEVKIGNWYYFGQTVVLRANDREKAKQMASVMRRICNNPHVGYDQGQRTTLWSAMSRVGWNPDKVTTNCECDCSSLIAVVCTAVGYNVSPDIWTGNMRAALTKTKKFTALTGYTYTGTDKNLRVGDIILNPETHVIMALQDGANIGSSASGSASTAVKDLIKTGQKGLNSLVGARLAIDGSRGPETKKVGVMGVQAGLNKSYRCRLAVDGSYGPATRGAVSQHPITKGSTGYYVKAVQCLLYVRGYNPKGIDGSFGPGMLAAVKAFQKNNGLEVDGSVGPKTMLRLVS